MKGFSFIGLVLLISFVIVSGLAVYYFYTSITRTSQASTEAEVAKLVECAGGLVNIKNIKATAKKGEIVLLLPLDEGSGNITYDYSGYGNNGTLYNGTVSCADPPTTGQGCPKWVDGKFGKALEFDEIDDYVQVPHTSELNIDKLTIEVWTKAASFDGFDYEDPVVSKHGEATGWELRAGNRDAVMVVTIDGVHYYAYTNKTLDANKWYHLVGTYDGSVIKIYVNGTLMNTSSISGPFTYFTGDLNIGRNPFWNDRLFNGTIDEVRIYNKALSEDEIKAHNESGVHFRFKLSNEGSVDLKKNNSSFIIK